VITYSELGVSKKWGRLGNQMFQYAALKGLAKYNNLDFAIPIHDDKNYDLIKAFDLDCKKIPMEQLYNEFKKARPFTFHFQKELLELEDGFDLIGNFFISEKWFKHIEDEIRDDFKFEGDTIDKVFIHVRRTDYINNDGFVDLMKTPYYENAMNHFPASKFLVFSDDIEWCKSQPIFDKCEFDNSETGIEALRKMTKCNGAIIANSTLSWWGAWLQKSDEDIISPNVKSTWLGPRKANRNTDTMIPENWIQL
tara:strand:+ start:26 stop:781 length:756 start_codon:yes stop_codon:yes gene_type:complete